MFCIKKHIVIIVFLSAGLSGLWAVPARKGGITVTDQDGKSLRVYLHGDEYVHWMTDGMGRAVQENADGTYSITTAGPAKSVAVRHRMAQRSVSQASSSTARPLNLAPKGLVLLTAFSDKAFATDIAEIDSMLNGRNYTRNYNYVDTDGRHAVRSRGSAAQYFKDQSDGAYVPQFVVRGPYTISKQATYYGQNDLWGNDQYAEDMIAETCQLAAEDGVDFSEFDNDGDGDIDFVYVIYAGFGEADGGPSGTVWPHNYRMDQYYYLPTREGGRGQAEVVLNGKRLNKYSCSNEINYANNRHTGIGSFCHEFSHVLGLPDLYETTGNGNWKTMGYWDVMDYGPYCNDGNTPPNYSGYERFFFGWLKPRVLNEPEQVTLGELSATQSVLMVTATGQHNLIGNDPNPAVFYLLENRQQTGWDEYIPGHGLMITKVQYSYNKWNNNEVNNTQRSLGVDLIEADGKAPTYSSFNYDNGFTGKATDLFPAGATSFKPFPIYPLDDITEADGVISFRFMEQKTALDAWKKDKENILAVYDMLGRQIRTDIDYLPHGIYVVSTAKGRYTIRIAQ